MGQNNKKYLDYAGLEKLVDLHAVVPHPQWPITEDMTEEGAYKLAFDEHGHIISKSALTAADLGLDTALHFVGVSTTDPLASTGATCPGHTGEYSAGDVCLYKRKKTDGDKTQGDFRDDTGSQTTEDYYEEYIYTGSAWELLGDADSYALKDITISGDGTYITGGGDLSANRTLSHKTYTPAAAAIKAIGRDAGGHVVIGNEIIVQSDGGGVHGHTTSTTIAKDTYVTGVTPTTKKLAINPTKKSVITGVPGEFKNLDVTSITPVSGTTTASLAAAGTAVNIAKAGTAVVYGTADVGTEVTGLAKRDANKTTVGNADIATDATIVGNANVGAATRYGTANVGKQITVDAGKADVGSAVVYGKANVGATVSVAQQNTSASTFLTSVSAAAPTTTITATKTTYNAEVSGETLVLTPVTLSATTTAPILTPTTDSIYGVSGSVNITPAVAAPSSQTLTPAVASERTVSFTPAVAAPDTQTLLPAVKSQETIYGVVPATKQIYGVTDAQVSILPAKAAPSTQKIIPAVANGTITPYTFTNVTVPVAASPVTVATGSLSVGGAGNAVLSGLGTLETVEAITAATIIKGTSGDVEMLESVKANMNAETVFTGTAADHTESTHTHTLAVSSK